MKYRDMLVTVRDRLQKLKSSGKSVDEAVAAKPLDDLDPVWGKGLFNADDVHPNRLSGALEAVVRVQ